MNRIDRLLFGFGSFFGAAAFYVRSFRFFDRCMNAVERRTQRTDEGIKRLLGVFPAMKRTAGPLFFL
jgi:hypothetical protein